jgi:NADH-quinone oxidoreductase subunit F
VTAIVRIGTSTCGLAAGAEAVLASVEQYVHRRSLPIRVVRTGCLGACHREPLVEVVDGSLSTLYGPVTPERVRPLLDRHFGGAERGIDRSWLVSEREDRGDFPFLGRQVKVTTQLCGVIDPGSVDDYLAHDGYAAFRQALQMAPDAVIQTIADARLRGRGGAGYPTALKWRFTREQPGSKKFIVCNADEGDPGAFMDRTMLEGDPHRVLEGMLIAAWAMGASAGYLFVRAEYPLAVRALRRAIDQARELGMTGDNILGSGMDFEFVLKEGAGAFVCGEETALLHSIEGQRGMPRMRPPYPSESGLWGQPTCINNVETFASVPSIILRGPSWFAGLGTERSGGTKAFALTGAVRRSGLVEIPIGLPLRDIVVEIGGGAVAGKRLKAVQLGGPSGGCVPESLLDTRVDYETIRATGAIMGSGGMVVVDDSTCMVDFARFFVSFSQRESCGKCVPCRLGTRKMLGLLEGFTRGAGSAADLARLHSLCETVGVASLCGLGQTAPNPVLTTYRYFEDEYRAHVEEHRCPAGSCAMGEAAGG